MTDDARKATQLAASESSYKQALDLLKVETDSSASINTRGASTAALTGVVIVLLGNFAARWIRRDDLRDFGPVPTKMVLAVSLLLAAAALYGAVHKALAAARPRPEPEARGRLQRLAGALKLKALAPEPVEGRDGVWHSYRATVASALEKADATERNDLLAAALQKRLKGQGERNNAKAYDIGWAYVLLEVGLIAAGVHLALAIAALQP